MTREQITARAADPDTLTRYIAELADVVAFPTEPGADAAHRPALAHLSALMAPMGFTARIIEGDHPPALLLSRVEGDGAADAAVLRPWRYRAGDGGALVGRTRSVALTERDGRLYGRGVADNKGQVMVCLTALRLVLEACGRARLQHAHAGGNGRGGRIAWPERSARG